MFKTKMMINAIIAIVVVLFTTGCSTKKLSVVSSPSIKTEEIKTIALSPGGGLLNDAIGLGLMKHGFEIYDTTQFSSLMVRMNLSEMEVTQPQNLHKIKQQGIDSILNVRTANGYDSNPDSASIKLISTKSGKVLAGGTWQNGSGGMKGSPADRMARTGLSEAGEDIADALAKEIQK